MASPLFYTNQGDYTLTIEPKHISNSIVDILASKLKRDLEGKCSTIGYIKPGSVKIIHKSLGTGNLTHFNGFITYHIKYTADICKPHEGMIIKSTVINSNMMGILCTTSDLEISPLNILLPRQHHIDNEEFNKLKNNDVILVSVTGIRYEHGDEQISVIGKLIED